jgi:hypothetical protein
LIVKVADRPLGAIAVTVTDFNLLHHQK